MVPIATLKKAKLELEHPFWFQLPLSKAKSELEHPLWFQLPLSKSKIRIGTPPMVPITHDWKKLSCLLIYAILIYAYDVIFTAINANWYILYKLSSWWVHLRFPFETECNDSCGQFALVIVFSLELSIWTIWEDWYFYGRFMR